MSELLSPLARCLPRLRRLNLAGNDLRTIPDSLFYSPPRNDGGGIAAVDIPGGIGGGGGGGVKGACVVAGGLCESLTSLDLSRNGLHDLPLALGRVRGLRFLEVAGNKLRTLFPALAPLRRLESLVASRNELQFCSLDLLLNNPNLRRLDVSNNYVSFARSLTYSLTHSIKPSITNVFQCLSYFFYISFIHLFICP